MLSLRDSQVFGGVSPWTHYCLLLHGSLTHFTQNKTHYCLLLDGSLKPFTQNSERKKLGPFRPHAYATAKFEQNLSKRKNMPKKVAWCSDKVLIPTLHKLADTDLIS